MKLTWVVRTENLELHPQLRHLCSYHLTQQHQLSPIQVVTGPSVEQHCWRRPMCQTSQQAVKCRTYIAKPSVNYFHLHNSYVAILAKQTRTLRSSSQLRLYQPATRINFQSKAFSITAPADWNSLSPVTKSFATITTFKAHLKTELLSAAYNTV